jgi:DNA-binding transcriptional regulator LsrR (DeoR family)
MVHDLKRLYARHFLMIRLAFQGWRHRRIAEKVGVARETVSRTLNSLLAKAELGRLNAEAEEILVNVPLHVERMIEMKRLLKKAKRLRVLECLVP